MCKPGAIKSTIIPGLLCVGHVNRYLKNKHISGTPHRKQLNNCQIKQTRGGDTCITMDGSNRGVGSEGSSSERGGGNSNEEIRGLKCSRMGQTKESQKTRGSATCFVYSFTDIALLHVTQNGF